MKLFEISNYLDHRVPLSLQEDYDNCGLLIGDKNTEINSVLVCLDCTEDVLDEAIKNGDNLIISHHPVLFHGIKKITRENYTEIIVQKAIKCNIAIYAMHTNLDNQYGGVSFELANKIPLQKTRVLKPKKNTLTKLTTYCPSSYTEIVRNALFDNGAGEVGQLYDRCSFTSSGEGSFRPLDGADPFYGKVGQESLVKEDKIEVVFSSYLQPLILSTLNKSHPYQEVAYTCFDIHNESTDGSGVIGEIANSMSLNLFLAHVKKITNCNVIRYNNSSVKKNIKNIAICGGSGRFLLEDAINQNADVFITSDFKYHDFFDCNDDVIVLDIGHYESEYFTQDLIMRILKEKFSKLAIRLTTICTNPILYY
jgi:dinuclear metal center YbgI/SA1388 family protein